MEAYSDVTIIGAGITGLCTAYELKKNSGGKKTVRVLERHNEIGSTAQASSVNCGIICSGVHYGSSKIKVKICDETLDLCTKLGDEVKFVKSGALEMLMN